MSATTLIDFLASMAILALLAESYGAIRRRMVGLAAAPFVLGVLFGIVAVIEMARPFEPFDGVLIDLRNIPVALAGAFLGWRGLVPCIAIAVIARLEFGGVGTLAGVAGIVVAGLAGMIWARKMGEQGARGFTALLCLALAMSAHLLTAVIMPRDLALWFFTFAAGPLLAANLVCVPLIGAIIQRESRRLCLEARLADAIQDKSATKALTGPAFADAVKSAFEARPFGTFAGFLIVGPRSGLLSRLMGVLSSGTPRPNVLPPIGLDGLVEHAHLVGRSADGRLFVPLTEAEVSRGASIAQDLKAQWHSLENEGATSHLSLDVQFLPVWDPGLFLRIVNQIALSYVEDWHVSGPIDAMSGQFCGTSNRRRGRIFDPTQHNALFAKADFLMDHAKR